MTRVGIVNPYWDFWASAVQRDFAADRAELAGIAAQTIEQSATVAWSVTVQPGDDTAALAAPLDDEIDAIVVVSTMAASPGALLQLLGAFPRVPVVLWAAHLGRAVEQDLSHEGITLRGGTVGLPMIGAAFTRAGRSYDVVVGEIGESEQIGDAVRRAGVAGAVRRARLGVVGSTIPGYEWARVRDDELARLGVEVVMAPPAALADRFRAATPDRALADGFAIDDDLDDRAVDTSMRFASALEGFVADERLTVGTINCHVPELRLDPEIGAAPCFALGRCTSAGVPFTCTGDVATALAMLLVSALDAPTLYHEIEALDEVSDEAILANSGEHDARFAAATPRRLIANPWFPHEPSTASALFSIAAGDASLVAFASGVDGEPGTVVVAEGRFTERTAPDSGTMNAAFVFDSGPVGEAWRRWGLAGVGHHSCATDRHVADDLEVVCRHLGLGFVRV